MQTPSAVVVVSHYNAWSSDQLIALLDQMNSIPAGYPFSVRVVVNQAENRPLILPDRHSEVEVFYRENAGYNIGAWEHGWRQPGTGDIFLFLQEECVIHEPNWLRVFVDRASALDVGLVGESLTLWSWTWDDVYAKRAREGRGPVTVFGQTLPWSDGMLLFLKVHGIRPSRYADSLQSLIVCARRDVLERIGGFPCGDTKAEAIMSEIAMSKRVQAAGLKVCQIAFQPFRYIGHPQWDGDRKAANRMSWKVRRALNLILPRGFSRRLRRLWE